MHSPREQQPCSTASRTGTQPARTERDKVDLSDLDKLLEPISEEAPSGTEDLEYDPGFMALVGDIEGTPAVVVDKRVVQDAKPPEWSKIRKTSIELLGRSHDLRLAAFLTRALLRTDGLPGFAAGVKIIKGYIENFWDSVFPQLDPEDDNDPAMRLNALVDLNDYNILVAPIAKEAFLCQSRTMGRISLWDVRLALGKVERPAGSQQAPMDMGAIEAAFKDTDDEFLLNNKRALDTSIESLTGVVDKLIELVGHSEAPRFPELLAVLKEMKEFVDNHLSVRMPSAFGEGENSAEAGEEAGGGDGGGARFKGVRNRQDVLRLLGEICAYYDRSEPASPVPLLLKRAMALVEKNFLELLNELAPGSVAQIQLKAEAGQEQKPQ